MAANPECISSLVEGLGSYMKLVLTLTDQADTPVIEAAITQLFSQVIQVCVWFVTKRLVVLRLNDSTLLNLFQIVGA